MDLASEVKQCLSSLWVVESDATMAVAMPNIDVWQPRVPCRFIFTLKEDGTVSAKLVFGLLKWFSDRQPSVLSALMDLHQQSTAPFTVYSKETWDTLAMSAKDIADYRRYASIFPTFKEKGLQLQAKPTASLPKTHVE